MRVGEGIGNRGRTFRSERGQAASEMMLLIAVVTIAVVAAAYSYVPWFRVGVYNLGEQVQVILDGGTVGGVGFSRDDSTGGDWNEEGSNDDASGLEDGEL